ncbi:Predicted arabinose efflux permease, MFS family [Modicisalibacter ilicicola DSM 19980]|uniref:Predicted arabinose efflux permease, MFS family n=1 Tax=Modicisalibacter ilicicola DSM 19980 TaxID=1121942 RepID=A0A1M4T1J7_9GAMM|nr:MFS transporter [Halomonas ilicicola]SHE38343.1 Predicted arabinose efflux permease, MFS family [Halomonas ilicicola DSM 19980]
MSRQLLAMALAPLLGLFILAIGNGFLATLITLRLDAAGESAVTIGWISSAYFIGLAFGAVFNDRMLLRIGHIRAYGSFASLVAVTVLLQGLWLNPQAWFVLRLVGGWATVGVYLVIESWLLTSGDQKVRGRLLALYMISLYAAGVIGQLLLGVTDAMSPTAPFMLVGMLASLSVLPMAMIPRVSPLIEHAEPLPPHRLITMTPTGVMASFGSGLAVAAVYALLPLYLHSLGLTVQQIGQMMAVMVLGAMLLQYPIGRWSDRHDRQLVLILIGAFFALISLGMLLLPSGQWLLAGLLFLLGGGVFALYPVAVSHAADRAPAGALVRMSQGLLLINALGSAISPPLITPVMSVLGDEGLFWSLGGLGVFLVLFFIWRRSVRPAPIPAAPFTANAPMTVIGAELNVTEELLQGAIEHEHHEDLSRVVPEVEVAEPLVGPPREEDAPITYFDVDAEAGAMPGAERHDRTPS